MSLPVRKNGVFAQLIRFVLPFAFVSIVLTAGALSWIGYVQFRRTIDQDYDNIVRSAAGEIRMYVNNARKDMEELAWVLAAASQDAWHQEMAVTAYSHATETFLRIALIAPDGRILAGARRGESDLPPEQQPLLARALAGGRSLSDVFMTGQNLPAMDVAVPVRRLGRVQAVLLGELSLKPVWDILEGFTIGRQGEVFLRNFEGRYLAHREMHRVAAGASDETAEILEGMVDAEGPVSWVCSEAGRYWYCKGQFLPELKWFVILRQPTAEIYAHLYRMWGWAVAFALGFCLAAALIGWIKVRRFLGPVHDLHRRALEMGRGDLAARVSVRTDDEIGDLGRAINEMAESLGAHIEKEVETAKALVHARNLATLGTASSKVTHEVGNLLNNVGMTLSSLRREALSETGQRSLALLEGESGRVRAFIHDILQFAKRPELRLTTVPLHLVAGEAAAAHDPAAREKGVALSLEWPADLPPVPADTRLVYQVFGNLIKNAVEACADGGSVTIGARSDDHRLTVTVADTGSGMDPDTAEQVFDPFFTTKGKKGTGLGLAVVKSIVEAHRGTIRCRSKPGEGTTFEMVLPLR